MSKWSEILPQDALYLATELEAHAQEERDNGKILYPPQEQIFKELEEDVGIKRPESGEWAENGVLLLNTSLTVYEHQANSCVRWGWDRFTKSATKLPQPVVFLLWGSNAQDLLKDLISCAAVYIVKENLIKKAYVLSSHPSPFSATRPCRGTPAFRGSKPFSTANGHGRDAD